MLIFIRLGFFVDQKSCTTECNCMCVCVMYIVRSSTVLAGDEKANG